MAEPASAGAASFLGVKYASLVAGFAGGVVSLSYLRPLSGWQVLLALATGVAVAGYVTPLVLVYLKLPRDQELENGAAFLLGLTAMNLVPGIVELARRFKKNPEVIIRKDEQ